MSFGESFENSPMPLAEKEEVKSEQKIAWEKKRAEVDKIADKLGLGIDEKIKETIAALNINGFPTIQSCEGHFLESSMRAPWVRIAADNEPEERYVNQNNILKKKAEKYGVSLKEVEDADHLEAFREAWKEIGKNKKTSEYKQWEKENRKLFRRFSKLLREFYKDRKVPDNVKLITEGNPGDEFKLHNGGKDYESANMAVRFGKSEESEKQKEGLEERLPL